MHEILPSVPTPIIFILFPFMIGGLFVNTLLVYIFTASKNVSLGKSFIASLYTYIVLAMFGLCITFYSNLSANFLWFLVYYLIAIGVEWLILIPYLRNYNISKFRLLYTSGIANTVVYGILTYMLFYGTGVVMKYAESVKILINQTGFSF